LTEDVNGGGVTLSVSDAMSSIEIGKTGGAAAGTLTIDSGVTVTEAGSFSAPTIVDKGILAVGPGESLYLSGTLANTGTLAIDAGSTITLNLASVVGTDKIAFVGGNGTLDLSTPLSSPNSYLSGFAAGDLIDLAGSWSLQSFSENSGGTQGTLTLTDGTDHLGLYFAGDFTANSFNINTGQNTIIAHT
jgi:hypothetical protein